jgi:hypothetical protein
MGQFNAVHILTNYSEHPISGFSGGQWISPLNWKKREFITHIIDLESLT